MIDELARVMVRVGKLPDREQKMLATILEQELEDEAAWARRFAETPETLEMLVKRAKAQSHAKYDWLIQ